VFEASANYAATRVRFARISSGLDIPPRLIARADEVIAQASPCCGA